MRIIFISILSLVITGCAASSDDKPNMFQRADVISKNNKSVAVQHSKWGNKIAFRLAEEHCASMDKVAVHMGTSQQFGPDVISTWRCE